ncbi:hypothetical protein SAMN05216378_2394 [Paenibacillus catalpae]|uniref:Uncharacterized protein n=1 Tax=Paenibacillus catalpae TaxID=1045775 RepID=A0A1I1XXJ7_9BACL|nr:hypothetical protein [Paenibacillus catalpae]SFE12106.1 hypothetical protein SAMN05216378_2394 [Paenibacillus catalpae]
MREAEMQATSTEDKRTELNIREILIQLDIPQEKWPTDLIQP